MLVYGQLEKAQLEHLAADPAPADSKTGAIYFRTTDHLIRYYNGTAWGTVVDEAILSQNTFTNPMTDVGDMVVGGALGVATRFAKGAANTVLHSGDVPSWALLTNANIDPVAAIDISKLGAVAQTDRVAVFDGTGHFAASIVDTTKLSYLQNVTSDLQAQIDSKLTSNGRMINFRDEIASAPPGVLSMNALGHFFGRTLTAGSNKISISEPTGSFGDPTFDVVEGNLSIENMTGTLPLNRGGTGQTEREPALNALLPSQTGNANKSLQTNGTTHFWGEAGGGGGTSLPPGVVVPFAANVIPAGWLLCDGSEISKTEYPGLYAVIDELYATQIDPATGMSYPQPEEGNFRIPDYRSLFLRGVGTNNLGVTTSLGERQDDATAKNGLANSNSSLSGASTAAITLATTNVSLVSGTAASAGAHTHTVTGTAASAGGHGHGLNGGTIGVFSGGGGLEEGQGAPNYQINPGSADVNGAHTHSVSGTAASNGAHTHTVTGTTNIGHSHPSVAVTGTALAQNINSSDLETRPQNMGVNYIIKI